MKISSWQGKEMQGMIRTLTVNCIPILDCPKVDRKTPAETASDENVMWAVWVLCEFSLHVGQQNHSDLTLTAVDDALTGFCKKKNPVREQKISKSAKAQVDDPVARESHQLRAQMIQKIRAALEVQAYWAEMVTTTRRTQFQVCLDRARHAATTWSNADRQSAIEQLKRENHQVTPVKRKFFKGLFQHHKWQQLQEVGTKATGPRSTFGKKLPQMKTAAEQEVYGMANKTADKRVEFRVSLSDDQTEAASWSIADIDLIRNQLEREIYCITSKDKMRFKKELSIQLLEFEAWGQEIGV